MTVASMLRTALLLASTTVLSLGVLPVAQANHLQDGVSFDSLGGNEWWVDVQLGGGYDFYGAPEVRDTNGGWAYMDHPSWAGPGRYVLSYHVEPGHQVKFRVTYKDTVMVSCWFTHPAGVENCGTEEHFTAAFTPSGNAESIRVRVDASQAVSTVNWVVTGTKGSWGGPPMQQTAGTLDGPTTWTTTTHVPDGEILKFNVYSNDDWSETATSGCFRWPIVTPVACPNDSDYFSVQAPQSYDGNLSHIEVDAYYSPWPDQNKTLQGVDVRFDGGTFHPMRFDRTQYYNDQMFRYDSAPTKQLTVAQFRGTASDGRVFCEQTAYFLPPGSYPPWWNSGNGIAFTHQSGNTGWVQTNVYASNPVVAVEASINGGPWKALQQQPWCDWAAAMDAPAGSVVFRGFFPDLTSFTSEAFSWNPSGGQTFGAQFFEVGGNEWWQQVSVNSFGGTLSKVEARVNGGAWSPLSKQSWGNNMYAGSLHAVDGSAVQFQLTSTAGDHVLSPCYEWLPAKPAQTMACPSGGGGGGTAFDATFTGVKGNEYWVQSTVTANQPLAGVDARVGCTGAWHALTKQSYGWAASFHVPAGSKVDFRARSTGGATDLSGGYIWPNATPTSAC